jgi:6-pyruvoyltetrahydropterin/6-carboxytetrahydropterin synthase
MRVTIVRRYDFEAAHFLPHVPDGHKCKTMHGHSYVVEVHVTGDVQETGPEAGMVLDFGIIDDTARRLFATWDHRPLNDLFPNPTVEVMAPLVQRHMAAVLNQGEGRLVSVRVHFHEGPRSVCIAPPYETPCAA